MLAMSAPAAALPATRSTQSNRYSRSPFGTGANSTSAGFRSDMLSHSAASSQSGTYSTSPTNERYPASRGSGGAVGMIHGLSSSISDPASFGFESRPAPTVIIRRLHQNIVDETLKSMLIFADELIDTEFIRPIYTEDQGYATAVARFRTLAGATEAMQKLNGKPNTTKDATMIVEIHGGSTASLYERRNTIDNGVTLAKSSSTSSGGSAGLSAGRSRFNSTFQSAEKVSPPLSSSNSGGTGEFPVPENSAHFKNLFSPHSPLTNGVENHRVSGKSVINDDTADDETGELLKDPVAYAKNGQHPSGRRQMSAQIPIQQMGRMSLNGMNNGLPSPMPSGMMSPRSAANSGAMSPSYLTHAETNGSYMPPMPPFSRPQYPPVNPADQNPPCNTLYVGNLPIDTSEDELKSIFSKQRGYKRLCFRTKQNGPMCFVEFEDTQYATRALNELYGQPLHNSVKGGIRLSFSKNPLGVRSSQSNNMTHSAIMSPQAMSPGYGMMPGASFSSVSGPPPGLATPPGLLNGGYRSPQLNADGMFANHMPVIPMQDFMGQISQRSFSGGVPPTMGNGTYGRDSHNGPYGGAVQKNYNDHGFGR